MALSSVLSLPLVPLFLPTLTLLHADLACHGSELSLALRSLIFLLSDFRLGCFLIRLGLPVEGLLHAYLQLLLRGHPGL